MNGFVDDLLRMLGPTDGLLTVVALAVLYTAHALRRLIASMSSNPNLSEHLSKMEEGQAATNRLLSGIDKNTTHMAHRMEDVWDKVKGS